MEKQTAWLQLGRVRSRRSARPHEPGDAREGAAGHRRGEGRHYFLPVAAARLSRRQRAQSPQVAAETGLHAPRGQAKLLLSPRRREPRLHRRRQRRPGAPHAAVLDAVGLVRTYRQPFRCRRRRRAGDRVLQRLSRRRGRQAGAGEPGERAVGAVRGDAGARAGHREPRRARRAGPRSAGGFESPLRTPAPRRDLRRSVENPGEGCCGDRERRYGVPVHRLRRRHPRAQEKPGSEAAARHLQRPRRARRAAAAVDLGFAARLPDRRQLRRRDHSDEPGEPQAARLDAAARALHLQEWHPSRRAVVSHRPGALAARARPQPLSAHRAAAAPAWGRRLARHADRDGLNSFDYIVVGAGSAGCVLASRLTESGRRSVLLLEAGPRDTDFWIHVPLGYGKLFARTDVNWAYESEPEPALNDRRIFTPRGKVLGGSSSINGLVYIRGQREDFDGWAIPGWGFDDLLPYFRKLEDQSRGADPWHGVGGPLAVSDLPRHELCDAFIASAMALGIPRNDDFNGATQEGTGYYQATASNGRRCSTAVGYLRPAEKRPNLKIEVDALVTRIHFRDPGHQSVDFDLQVRSLLCRPQVADRGAAAAAVGCSRLVVAGAFLRGAVEVVVARNAQCHGRCDEGVAQLVARQVRHGGRVAAAIPGVDAAALVLRLPEVRQEIVETPARDRPAVEVLALAADIDQTVDRGGAAENFAARREDAPVVQRRLGLRLVRPVDVGTREQLAVAERHVDPEVGVARPGFEEKHAAAAAFGEPVGEDATRGPGPDDDVIERIQTVAIGVAGEPTAPGRRSGGAVSRKRLRPCSRSQRASAVRYHSSPRWMPFLKMQCSCSGIEACGFGLVRLVGMISTA